MTIGTTLNHGVVLGRGSYGTSLTITNTGKINGTNCAVYVSPMYAEGASVSNAGTLSSGDAGVVFEWGGTLTNTGIISGATVGVVSEYSTSLINSGQITGSTLGVYLKDSRMTNTGTISSS